MQDVEPADDEINFADHSLALTRRFRALRVWLSVKTLGVGWFRTMIAHCCNLAEFAQGLLEASPVFEVVCPRQLGIVCFRFVPTGYNSEVTRLDAINLDLIEKLRATGRGFISSTRLNGRVALRFCFVNWRTTAADVEELVRLLESL